MKQGLVIFLLSALLLAGCLSPSATTTSTTYSRYQQEYHLLAYFDNYFWCNPYLYPIAREDQEQADAIEQFPQIVANSTEFSAIVEYLAMDRKAEYTNEEKLLIFRQHEILSIAVETTTIGSGGDLNFVLRIGQGQGERIEGTITAMGKITVNKREPSTNTCPICLPKQTLIDTPVGPVPVEDIREGMMVWTRDNNGNRMTVPVVEISATLVPTEFQLVLLKLADGRELRASPGHPTAEGRTLGEYKVGQSLDGSKVVIAERVVYQDTFTYDIRPSGSTSVYWANGILLKSTLTGK